MTWDANTLISTLFYDFSQPAFNYNTSYWTSFRVGFGFLHYTLRTRERPFIVILCVSRTYPSYWAPFDSELTPLIEVTSSSATRSLPSLAP